MNCPHCGAIIPALAMACRPCIEKRATASALAAQIAFVIPAATGRLEIHVMRRFRGAANGHIALFGHRHVAFCGEQLANDYPRKERAVLGEELRRTLCAKCLGAFDALLAQKERKPGAALSHDE